MASKLNFADDDTPPENVVQDVQTLNKLNEEQFSQLLGIIFGFLSNTNQINQFNDALSELAETENLNISTLKTLTKTLIYIPTYALRKNFSKQQLESNLNSLGFTSEKQEIFVSKWVDNYDALTKMAMKKILTINQLVDLEWKFGVTAATSEADQVGNIFLQLKLTVKKGNTLENVFMELTLPQFYAFLHEMERAKASLDYFSS